MEILDFATTRFIFKSIALVQIFLLSVLVSMTFFYKFFQEHNKKQQKKILYKITQLLIDYQTLDADGFQYLIAHRQISFDEFYKLEKQGAFQDHSIYIAILNNLFLPYLREYVYSKHWFLRNQAAMMLQLKGKYFNILTPEDEAFLIQLMDDSVAKVSINACMAALFSPTQKTIDYFIDLLSQKRRSQYEILKTILNQSSLDVGLCIQKRLNYEKNLFIRAFCYRVLGEFPKLELSFPFLKTDLDSEEINLKLAALSYCYHVQHPYFKKELIKAIHSSHWEVRARSAKLMGYTQDEILANALQPLLGDDVWWVRYRAAEALTKMGDQGQRILNAQDIKVDKFAYEMSQQQLQSSSFNRGK